MAKIQLPSTKASPFFVKPLTDAQAYNAEASTTLVTATNGVVEKLVPAQVSGSPVVYTVGQSYDVPTNLISSNPRNSRWLYTSAVVSQMQETLRANGQRQSATGFVDEKGGITLIEGETRLRATRQNGSSTLRVEIKKRPQNDRALYEASRGSNVERNDQTPIDDAMRWKELLASNVYKSQRDLAEALGLVEDVVSRTLSLSKMGPRVYSALGGYPSMLNLKMLVAIREYHDVMGEDETLQLIFEVDKGGLGSRDVTARRKSAQKEPSKKPRSVRSPISFKGGKGEIKSFEEDGRVEVSLSGLSPADVEEVTALLTEMLKKEK